MKVRVLIKQVGKRKPIIGEQELQLTHSVETLQELIEQIVAINVDQYNNQTIDELWIAALGEREIEDKAEQGKVGFNVKYNSNIQDLPKALENARLSFEDGLYKVFINEIEIEQWKMSLSLKEDDRILFLRLVMLAGRTW